MSHNRSTLGGSNVETIELQVRQEASAVTSTVPTDEPHLSREDYTEPLETADVDEYPTGFKLFAITIGLVLSIFLSALDSTIIATAIPSITNEFGSIRSIAWYGSAYQITNTAFQPTWGKAYKHFPLKRVFLLTVAVFEIGNVVCAAAPNSPVVILGRVIAGIGGSGIMTGSFIIIAMTARPQYRPAYMGVLGVTFGCASIIGPLMGGTLTDGLGWRWCFWVSLPIGAAAALMIFIFFSQPANAILAEMSLKSKLGHTDLLGALLITGALSCFVMAMHWAGTLAWSSAPVIGCLIGFVGIAVSFAVNEWFMGSMAMLQPHFFRKKAIVLNLIFIFFLSGVYFPLLFSLPVQFQSINNDSASRSGTRLIPLVLGICLFTMVTNGLLTVWRHYHPLLIFGALAGTAGVSMIYTVDANTTTAAWAGFEILTAAGVGFALQTPMIANQDAVSRDDITGVTSLSLFVENLGTALFVAASEAAFTTGLVSSLHANAPTLDPVVVVDTGVTQLRAVFHQPKDLTSVLRAYLDGCKISHIVSVFCGVAAAVVSLVGAWPAGARALQIRLQKPHLP